MKKWLFMATLLWSCERKTEFFPLQDIYYISDLTRYEYIVVSNPPDHPDSLAKLIIAYNDSTLDINYYHDRKISFERRFFKETRFTPRNYKEDEGYLSEDHIGDHFEDIIAVVTQEVCQNKDSLTGIWLLKVKGKEDMIIKNFCDVK